MGIHEIPAGESLCHALWHVGAEKGSAVKLSLTFLHPRFS